MHCFGFSLPVCFIIYYFLIVYISCLKKQYIIEMSGKVQLLLLRACKVMTNQKQGLETLGFKQGHLQDLDWNRQQLTMTELVHK